MRKLNNYQPETKSLFAALIAAGFELVCIDNGEDVFKCDGAPLGNCVVEATATDEARVKVRKGEITSYLYLVLGNEPGVLVCDYSGNNPELDTVVDAHYDKWSERKQPTITVD